MGKRGPAPTAKHVLADRGSWRAGLRGADVEYPTGAPSCPKSMPAEGKKEWRRVVKLLTDAGVLQVADLAMLASYCRTWSEWCQLSALSDGWNYAVESDRKQARMLAEAELRLQRFAAEFGFSPQSRPRVAVPAERTTGAITWRD